MRTASGRCRKCVSETRLVGEGGAVPVGEIPSSPAGEAKEEVADGGILQRPAVSKRPVRTLGKYVSVIKKRRKAGAGTEGVQEDATPRPEEEPAEQAGASEGREELP